jgi:ubiquinone/menaquinone biosynthesis C-methylase UbiE
MTRHAEHQTARVQAVFDDWAARGRADGMERSHAPFVRPAFQRLALRPDAWYLDIGCGNGYTVRWAAEAAPQGQAVGIDLSSEMIALARRLSTGFENVAFHQCAFPAHQLPRDGFDIILSMEVFYYLPDMAAALEETRRLLKPGGRFACLVDFYGENTASHSWPEDVGVEMTLLDAAGWRRALEAAGLEVIDQDRIRLSPDEASEPWKATEGSLLTLGRRPA